MSGNGTAFSSNFGAFPFSDVGILAFHCKSLLSVKTNFSNSQQERVRGLK